MPNAFDRSYYKPNKRIELSPEVLDYSSKKIVLEPVITGYEDEAKLKPKASLVHKVVEEKTNIKKLVNSHVKEVGVANIIARIAKTGDMSLLEQGEPIYGDLTGLPQSDAEVKAKAMALESIYAKLPEDIKKNMSISEFVTTMTDDKIIKYLQDKEKEAGNPAPEGE